MNRCGLLRWLCNLALAAALLGACQKPPPMPIPPTSTPVPSPTSTLMRTHTPSPTPTCTPTVTATPTSTPTPTPTGPPPAVTALRWERIYNGAAFERVAVSALAVHPAQPDTIFAGTYGAGTYVTRDGGKTWTHSDAGLGNGTAGAIIIDPQDPNILYVALRDRGGVFKSTDGGRTWQAASEGIDLKGAWGPAGLIWFEPQNSRHLYYTHVNALYYSEDAAATWVQRSSACPLITSLAVDPSDGSHLYASSREDSNTGCLAGAYESTDGGRTWTRFSTVPLRRVPGPWCGDDYKWHVAADPRDFSTVYAGGGCTTLKSTDGGQTWVKIRMSGDGCTYGFVVNPDDGALYCNLGTWIRVSYDAGESWSGLYSGSRLNWELETSLVLVPGTQTLYFGRDEVIKSTDGGRSWRRIGRFGARPLHLTVDPRDGKRLFLSNLDQKGTGQAYRSTDGGRSWRIALSDVRPGYITIDPVRGIVYRANWWNENENKGYRSSDGGETWQAFGSGYVAHPYQLVPDPQNPSRLWLLGECEDRLAVSEDGGQTFERVSTFPSEVCRPFLLLAADGKRMYVIVEDGNAFRSDDGGESWRQQWLLDHTKTRYVYVAAELDPTNPDIVYAGSSSNGVLKTSDGGDNWEFANAGLTNLTINDLAIDPHNPQTLCAATDDGVFVSVDGAEHWWPARAGLGPNPIVYSVAVDPSDPAKVYAVTSDGVFRLARE